MKSTEDSFLSDSQTHYDNVKNISGRPDLHFPHCFSFLSKLSLWDYAACLFFLQQILL